MRDTPRDLICGESNMEKQTWPSSNSQPLNHNLSVLHIVRSQMMRTRTFENSIFSPQTTGRDLNALKRPRTREEREDRPDWTKTEKRFLVQSECRTRDLQPRHLWRSAEISSSKNHQPHLGGWNHFKRAPKRS